MFVSSGLTVFKSRKRGFDASLTSKELEEFWKKIETIPNKYWIVLKFRRHFVLTVWNYIILFWVRFRLSFSRLFSSFQCFMFDFASLFLIQNIIFKLLRKKMEHPKEVNVLTKSLFTKSGVLTFTWWTNPVGLIFNLPISNDCQRGMVAREIGKQTLFLTFPFLRPPGKFKLLPLGLIHTTHNIAILL